MKKIQIFVFYFQSFSWKTWDFGESSPQSTALVWSFWSAASTSASVSLEISRFQNCNHCENVVEKNKRKTEMHPVCIPLHSHMHLRYVWYVFELKNIYEFDVANLNSIDLSAWSAYKASALSVVGGVPGPKDSKDSKDRAHHDTTTFYQKKQDKERTWESFSFPKKSVMPTEQRSSSFQRSQLLERQSHTLLLHCYFSHALEKYSNTM